MRCENCYGTLAEMLGAKDKQITELQAHVNHLREALKWVNERSIDGMAVSRARKSLSTTPTQSLIEHDNEVIERCAMVVDEQMKEHGGQDYYIIGCGDAADSIRKLKATS